MNRIADDAIWASVDEVVRDVIVPALPDGHARLMAIQLAAVATWARSRGEDPSAAREADVSDALASIAGNSLVPYDGTPSARAAAALAAAVGQRDGEADEVREVLRPILLAHLDADVAEYAALEDGFRGRLPGA